MFGPSRNLCDAMYQICKVFLKYPPIYNDFYDTNFLCNFAAEKWQFNIFWSLQAIEKMMKGYESASTELRVNCLKNIQAIINKTFKEIGFQYKKINLSEFTANMANRTKRKRNRNRTKRGTLV